MWSAEDEAIIATNSDASECKRSAVELGYWKDEYISYFVRRAERKAPEINRGYYTRVRAMEMFIHQFLELCGSRCQIINLGCGFDTLFWRLRDSTRAFGNFIELDFPTVTAKKCQIIKRNKALLDKITDGGEVETRDGDLHAARYHLAGCDLRCLPEVKRKLAACGLVSGDGGQPGGGAVPALVLAECVLVYLPEDAECALLQHLAAALPSALLLQYEQCALGDTFGEVMLRNLAARGCQLAGGERARQPAAGLAARLAAAGWTAARAWPLTEVWRALPAAERAALQRREPLDEGELLHQLHGHYALAVASTGALLQDLHLPDLDLADLAAATSLPS